MASSLVILLALMQCAAATASAGIQDGFCDATSGQCTPGSAETPKKAKRYSEPEVWKTYLSEIENAKRIYEDRKSEYEKGDCSLYNDVIEREFLPFATTGITREIFTKARKHGVLYQIANRTLYRSQMVLYIHRCAGVEHFLHRIIPNLGPNVTLELVINDRDIPVSKHWAIDYQNRLTELQPLPVFSYSKPFYAEISPDFIERQRKINAVVSQISDSADASKQLDTDQETAKSEDSRKLGPDIVASTSEKSIDLDHSRSAQAHLMPSESYYDILMPTWTFWEGGPIFWPYYPGPQGLGRWDLAREHVEKKIKREYEWMRKIPVAFFRGTRIGSERDALIRLSASKPQIANAEFTKSHHWQSVDDTLGFQPAVEVGLMDHCRYKLLFNFDGIGASVRLRHLFLCRSVVLGVNLGAKREFFTDSLIKWYHYIPVASNASESELESLIEFFLAHDNLAEQIAENGYRFIREHLELEDVECYWRRLIRRYSSLVRYEVERDSTLIEIPYGKLVDPTRHNFRP